MGDNRFTWVINNVSSEKIYSNIFVIGGCRWRVVAGKKFDECLYLSLAVADTEYLPCGWRRQAEFSFTLVNQVSEQLSQVQGTQQEWFDENNLACDCASSFPLDAGFLLNGQVKIIVEIKVVQLIGKSNRPVEKIKINLACNAEEETVEVNGFPVYTSHVEVVRGIFEQHPDIASSLHPETALPCAKTGCIYLLIRGIMIVQKPPQEITNENLSLVHVILDFLRLMGFKLDWLEKELNDLSDKEI